MGVSIPTWRFHLSSLLPSWFLPYCSPFLPPQSLPWELPAQGGLMHPPGPASQKLCSHINPDQKQVTMKGSDFLEY